MRKPIFAALAIILGVALCWVAPPVDKLPSLLTTPAEARNISVIVGGSPPAAASGAWYYSDATPSVNTSDVFTNAADVSADGAQGCRLEIGAAGSITKVGFKTMKTHTGSAYQIGVYNVGGTTQLACCSGTTNGTSGWQDCTLSSAITGQSANTEYLIVYQVEIGTTGLLGYDGTTGGHWEQQNWGACPATITRTDDWEYGVRVWVE